MLKITKGLIPFVEDGITTYTDSKGDKYVRVKVDGEDFCIAPHDYSKGGRKYFTWDEAMKGVADRGLTLFTRKQAELYRKHREEINNTLKEIGGDALKEAWYWTSEEREDDKNFVYVYVKDAGYPVGVSITDISKERCHQARPILNL